MSVICKCFDKMFYNVLKGNINFNTHSFKAMLCTSSYVPDQLNHENKSQITNEISASGYSSGGVALTNLIINFNATSGLTYITADNFNIESASIVARVLVIYDDTPSADADKKLVGYVLFDGDMQSNNSQFGVTWSSNGFVSGQPS